MKLAMLVALGSVCAVLAIGGTAPAQTGFLACVKVKNPGKGLLRMSSTGTCRGNERGVLINQTGPQGPAGTPGGPQGPQGIQGPIGPQGIQGIQGSQGLQGSQGIQGNQGVQGNQGIQGPPGASGYTSTSATSGAQSDATEAQDVTCPGSKDVLGGGYQIARTDLSDKVVATESYPVSSTTWRVTAELISAATPTGTWTVTAYATCATAS